MLQSVISIFIYIIMSSMTNLHVHVTLASNMSFSPHIQKITAKATRVLNFIKLNLYNCSKEIKSKACLTLVCPILEYASPVWDPHLVKDCEQIEKVQRGAACWVTSDYSWLSNVTAILSNLNWPILLPFVVKSPRYRLFIKPFTT